MFFYLVYLNLKVFEADGQEWSQTSQCLMSFKRKSVIFKDQAWNNETCLDHGSFPQLG